MSCRSSGASNGAGGPLAWRWWAIRPGVLQEFAGQAGGPGASVSTDEWVREVAELDEKVVGWEIAV